MQMVRSRLEAENIHTVWFNAWKYDGKEVLWNALLQTVFYEMKQKEIQSGEKARKELLRRIARMAGEFAKYSAKVGTRVVPGGILQEKAIDAVVSLFASSGEDSLFEFVNRFEYDFDELTREYVSGRGSQYLVIFIDDLDRCLPENAIQVMEALKLYLDRANCVFVVGAEPAVIEEAIRRRYADNPSLSPREYLEKIVQVPFVMPRIRTRDALLLRAAGTAFPRHPEMARLVRLGTERNPRRVKRFFNAFEIASENSDPLSIEEQCNLAKVLLIQLGFPEFYQRLTKAPHLLNNLACAERQAWTNAGVQELYEDDRLRRFLSRTRSISPEAKEVLRWVRVHDLESETDEDESGGDMCEASEMITMAPA